MGILEDFELEFSELSAEITYKIGKMSNEDGKVNVIVTISEL
jgi:hypothetical protein